MNNGPEDGREDGEWTAAGEVSEAAMEAVMETLLRTEWVKPLALPDGFAERALARAAAEIAGRAGAPEASAGKVRSGAGKSRVSAFTRRDGWRLVAGGALAASLVAGTFGVELERRHREAARRATGLASLVDRRVIANQQFEEASRITDAALEHTRAQLERAGVFEDRRR